MSISKTIAALAIFGMSATMASAATISVNTYSPTGYDGVVAGGTFVGEDFEQAGRDMGEGEVGRNLSTDVGTFSTLGGTGNGGTVSQLSGNTGTQLALRDGNVYGRFNVQPLGGQWFLDSNDTYGINWDVETGGMFNTIAFAITDASEFSYLRIMADGASVEQRTGGRLRDGNTSLVVIQFDQYVSSANIQLGHFQSVGGTQQRNDGFSIDGAQVGVAPVPLPASLPLLAFGAAALVALRRRQKS